MHFPSAGALPPLPWVAPSHPALPQHPVPQARQWPQAPPVATWLAQLQDGCMPPPSSTYHTELLARWALEFLSHFRGDCHPPTTPAAPVAVDTQSWIPVTQGHQLPPGHDPFPPPLPTSNYWSPLQQGRRRRRKRRGGRGGRGSSQFDLLGGGEMELSASESWPRSSSCRPGVLNKGRLPEAPAGLHGRNGGAKGGGKGPCHTSAPTPSRGKGGRGTPSGPQKAQTGRQGGCAAPKRPTRDGMARNASQPHGSSEHTSQPQRGPKPGNKTEQRGSNTGN